MGSLILISNLSMSQEELKLSDRDMEEGVAFRDGIYAYRLGNPGQPATGPAPHDVCEKYKSQVTLLAGLTDVSNFGDYD